MCGGVRRVMSEEKTFEIFVLSDGTGETVDKAVRAALTQFDSSKLRVVRYKSVRSKEQVDAILEEAQRRSAAVAYTAVSDEVLPKFARHNW